MAAVEEFKIFIAGSQCPATMQNRIIRKNDYFIAKGQVESIQMMK